MKHICLYLVTLGKKGEYKGEQNCILVRGALDEQECKENKNGKRVTKMQRRIPFLLMYRFAKSYSDVWTALNVCRRWGLRLRGLP